MDTKDLLKIMLKDSGNYVDLRSRKVLKNLSKKRPSDLVLVIGSGVSAAVAPGVPALRSWRCCMEAVIDVAEQFEVLHPGDVVAFRKRVLGDQDSLAVVHDLIRKMSPSTGHSKPSFFQDCLMEIFDDLESHIQNPTILESIVSLMDKGAKVLTTNYDNLLELYGQKMGRPMKSLDLNDKVKVLRWVQRRIKYGVLHIHGLYTDPCGLILDRSGYKDAVQDYKLMLELLKLYSKKCFVFLGCGETLLDQIFQALSLYIMQNKVSVDHYMLVRKENADTFYKLQADLLFKGIKLMSYGDSFTDFPLYIKGLSALICKERTENFAHVKIEKLLEPFPNIQPAAQKRKLDENTETGKPAKLKA
ncbi:protein FAM118A-like [Pelobates fuscus]|uniref:protein FAM118A-like n=1 Tax=Pelobates fuscus TaxID=191477 RepID=UPI002FE4D417